jgi:hypothetical protein
MADEKERYEFDSLPRLFVEDGRDDGSDVNDAPDDQDILRCRTAALNFETLRAGRRAEAGIAFNLFADVSLVGVVTRLDEFDGGVTLSGTVNGLEGRSFVITEHNGSDGDIGGAAGIVVGYIQGARSDFEIRPSFADEVNGSGRGGGREGGGYLVQEIDPGIRIECGVEAKHMVAPPRGEALKEIGTLAEDGSRIDSLVIYTAGALDEAGGSVPFLEGLVRNAESLTNTIFRNSRIDTTLRVVGIVQVNFQESGSYGADLDRIIASTAIRNLRNQFNADQVTLIRLPGSHHGIAYRTGGSSQWDRGHCFSVVSDRRIVRGYVFTHELGHNLGCAHNRANVDAAGIFPYSYGQWFYGNSGRLWGTIMSYPGQRIPHFSNPSVNYDGVPTGHAALRDNARTIRETKRNVANYRQSAQLLSAEKQAAVAAADAAGDRGAESETTKNGEAA